MHVVQINYTCDGAHRDADHLLDEYPTLTGWSRALTGAGARVTVVQRFHRSEERIRDSVRYIFRRSGEVNGAAVAAGGDIVHVNGLIFPARTWLLRRRLPASVPVVIQDHTGGEPGRRLTWPIGRDVRRLGLAAADGFFFAAREQASPWLRRRLILPGQAVYEVMEAAPALSGVPRQLAREASGISGSPALLWVGRLNSNKDPLKVLAGFERALPLLTDATLTMVYGEDDLLPAVAQRIKASAELRERVRLVGRVRHEILAAYYSAADIFVLGSHHEAAGYALLEACSCGAVPVVTDIPSFRAITGRGAIGALWTPGDAAAFSRALVRMARADLASESARVIEHIDRTFRWPMIAASALTAYEDVRMRRSAALFKGR